MIRNYRELFDCVRQGRRRTLAIPSAEGESIVEACGEAAREGICDSILIGAAAKINGYLNKLGIAETGVRVLDEPDPEKAVAVAVAMVRRGEAEMLMKGKTDTKVLMKAVLDGETGLRTGRVLSHVAVIEMASWPKLMIHTDGGLNIRPDAEKRMDIIRNAVEVAGKLGVARPNVALLSAMEGVDPKREETLDYERILKTQAESPFTEAVIEGPMAMDVALSAESARIKGVLSHIAGDTDIFVTPDIASANIAVKSLIYLAGAKVGGLVVGASAPIVLLSRADDSGTKLRSIALGALWGN
ncbi:MAG: phosphate butyryltransferase [Acidobacteria bacterium]|nr:phosphate butyryltransferase [Acidobacteriota bacterium]